MPNHPHGSLEPLAAPRRFTAVTLAALFAIAIPGAPRAQPIPPVPATTPMPPPAPSSNTPTVVAVQLDTVSVEGNYANAVGSSNAASQGSVTAKLIESRPTLARFHE